MKANSACCTSTLTMLARFVLSLFIAAYTANAANLHEGLDKGLFDVPHCFITLHEVAGKNASTGELTGRDVELNWFNAAVLDGDWIGVFNYDPSSDDSTDHQGLALQYFSVGNESGYIKTDIRIMPENFTSVDEQCLHYWIAYFHSSDNFKPVLSNCLRLYPRWMNVRAEIIGNVPITSLMLPGTHDAGAWKVYDGINDNVVTKYTFTQEESIYNQLVSGIRYLDVRVAYYPREQENVFWVNHGEVRIRELNKLLDDVKRFVDLTKEVVIMDFHGFPVGFPNDTIHGMLYDFVVENLGDFLAPKRAVAQTTLNTLWETGKYILWTYNDDFHSQRELLWSPLQHAWGDKNTVEDLQDYLPTAINTYGCKGYLWSAMTEITPTAQDIILKPNYGLRRFAYDVNKPLHHWYQDIQWYSRSNIISTDFYMGNNIIETSVIVNENRGVIC